eukprot:2712166-Pleurochrysis_carterae.AAC.1
MLNRWHDCDSTYRDADLYWLQKPGHKKASAPSAKEEHALSACRSAVTSVNGCDKFAWKAATCYSKSCVHLCTRNQHSIVIYKIHILPVEALCLRYTAVARRPAVWSKRRVMRQITEDAFAIKSELKAAQVQLVGLHGHHRGPPRCR